MDEIAAEGNLRIRRMHDDDYERMARWRNEPHVREWWDPDDPAMTLEAATVEYGPLVRGEDPATACVIELDGRGIGYIQFYPWDEEPDAIEEMTLPPIEGAWGIDLLLGEPDVIGQGVGTRAVDLLCRYLFADRGAGAVLIVAAIDNLRALRVYEKAGFVRTARVLDTDTRGGLRVESWALIRARDDIAEPDSKIRPIL